MTSRRFDDLCSPVLVKEVRQALRGRMFAFVFTGALCAAALLAGAAYAGSGADGASAGIVEPTFTLLVGALLVYVPFHAQQTMRQEDSEGARDLLALTPLGPWRVVLGKLLASQVVALLILAAFLPFVCVVSLLPGVDTIGVLAMIAFALGVGVLLSAFGISAGAARTNRFGKGAGTVSLAFLSVVAFAFVSRASMGLRSGVEATQALMSAAVGWLGLAALGLLVLGLAASSLARDDREIARGLRLAWLAFALSSVVLVCVVFPASGVCDDGESLFVGVGVLLLGTFAAAPMVTEREDLGVEDRLRIARARTPLGRLVGGLLAAGGGRGAVCYLASGALVAAASATGSVLSGSRGSVAHALLVAGTALAVSFAFAVIPARIVVVEHSKPEARRLARWISGGALVTLSLLLPLLLLVATQGGIDEDEVFFSPLFVLMEASNHVDRGRGPDPELLLWTVIGAFGIVAASPAMARGIGATLGVRSAARAAARGAPPGGGGPVT